MQGLCTIVQHDKKCQPSPKTRKFASKMLAKHALTIPGLSAARDLRFGRASANSSIKKRGHTQYEFDPLLSVLPNPRTLPFQRRQHPRQLFLTAYLSPLSNCGPSNGAAFLRCHLEDARLAGVRETFRMSASRPACRGLPRQQVPPEFPWHGR
jgi:hypothetical protein